MWYRVKNLKSKAPSDPDPIFDKFGNKHFNQYSHEIDTIGNEFLQTLQSKITNCGDVNSVSFIQMISFTGLIPPQLVCWSSIGSTSSGGFKFVNRSKEYNKFEAQFLLWEAQHEIQRVYGKFISLAFIENCCCEFHREMNSDIGVSSKKDVFYKIEKQTFPQSFFRCRQKTPHELSIEMIPGGDECSNYIKEIKHSKKHTAQEIMFVKSMKRVSKTSISNHLVCYSSYDPNCGVPEVLSTLCVHSDILIHYKLNSC